jgi:hypothetical protein
MVIGIFGLAWITDYISNIIMRTVTHGDNIKGVNVRVENEK